MFRVAYTQVRVRENAESIAFYDAAGAESATVGARLSSVVATVGDLIWWFVAHGSQRHYSATGNNMLMC